MSKGVLVNCSIECQKSDLEIRKPIKQGLTSIIGIDGKSIRVFKYKTQKRGEARVNHELEPKKAKINTLSMLNEGDLIEGEVLEIYTEDHKVEFNVVEGRTSTHGAQLYKTKKFTYAKVATAWRFLMEREFNSLIEAPKKQLSTKD